MAGRSAVRRSWLVVLGVAVAALLCASSTSAAPPKGPPFAGSKRCAGQLTTSSGAQGFDMKAKGGTCRRARLVVARVRSTRTGDARVSGYRCRALRTTYQSGGFYRCSQGRFTVQFGYGA